MHLVYRLHSDRANPKKRSVFGAKSMREQANRPVIDQRPLFKSKFRLMRMQQSEKLYIVTQNLYQNVTAMQKSVFIANFGQT